MEQELRVSVKEIETPSALLMDVQGSMESWQGFGAVAKIIETSVQKLLLISMKNVDCINCAGIGKLMAMSFLAKELGKKVCFAGMQPGVRRVLESLAGHRHLSVYDSEQEALAAGESQ
jgi:anti-anti-sigma regulatory factor